MSNLKGRITRLERRLPIGIEAELRAMSDKALDAEIAKLEGVPVKAVRAWSLEEMQRCMDAAQADRPGRAVG